MARYINKPDTTPPHECNPPLEKYAQKYWSNSVEVRTRRGAAAVGTIWQCDCGKIWRFKNIDSNSGSWYLLEDYDRWVVHPRKTWKWFKTARYCLRTNAILVAATIIGLLFFDPALALVWLFCIFISTLIGAVALWLDKTVWDHEVQDAPSEKF